MKILFYIYLVVIYSFPILAQQTPQVMFELKVTDGRENERVLRFGIDPSASDSIDEDLEEFLLPPFPPQGVFEAQILLPKNNFSGAETAYSDFRYGTIPFSGEKEHRIKLQRGEGDSIMFYWDLPPQITCRMKDIGGLVDEILSGQGSYKIPDVDEVDKVKLFVTYDNASSIEDKYNNLNDFVLYQNYPNPFNPITTIRFKTNISSQATIKLFDLLGNEIAILLDEYKAPGIYETKFNAEDLSSGIYLYQIIVNNLVQTKIMTLLK